MPRKGRPADQEFRLKVAALLRRMLVEFYLDKSVAAFARRFGVHKSTMNNALLGTKTVGVDFLLSVKHHGGPRLDFWDEEPAPDEKWYDPDSYKRHLEAAKFTDRVARRHPGRGKPPQR